MGRKVNVRERQKEALKRIVSIVRPITAKTAADVEILKACIIGLGRRGLRELQSETIER